MNELDSHIRRLIVDYFSGNLDEEDTGELLAWVRESDEHKFLFKKCIRELYVLHVSEEWRNIDSPVAKERVSRRLSRRRSIYRFSAVAAVVAAMLVSSVFMYFYQDPGDAFIKEKIYSELMQQQGRHQAILSIGKDRKVILNGSVKDAILADSSSRVFVDDSCVIRYEQRDPVVSGAVPVHTLEVPRGSEFRLTLSDGTRVWMNAGSKLSYPEFFDGKEREVTLTGEAYFEVVHDEEVPFVVKTADMGITVLGTSFNVKAYPEDECVITTLATGRIKQKYISSGEEIVLNPSDQSVFMKSSGLLRRERVDVSEVIGWKNGRVILKNKSLDEIFKELARWYDFDVEYKNESLRYTRFYLNIDRYDDIKLVLEKLQKTNGVKFIFYGRKVIVYDDIN